MFVRQGLLFREVEASDLDILRLQRNDLAAWPGYRDPHPVMTLHNQDAWYLTLGRDNMAFIIEDPQSSDDVDKRIGLLRISNFDRLHRSVGLTGCDVFPHAGRRGYGTRIMRGGVEFCIHTLGFHRVTAQSLDDNIAAQRIIEKAGFTEEGAWRKYLKREGVWHDFIQYSILEDEL